MIALEFCIKISSAYSIRVPYSYQCARTYPLPAPSTIKGLCANALWRKENDNPVKLMKDIHEASLGATSRAEHLIVVSSCTVRIIPQNALLRQFAFTPHIDCMIVFKNGNEALMDRVAEALKISPVYLGDSESLVSVMPESINSDLKIENFEEGRQLTVNSFFKFGFVKNGTINEKGTVFYMQDDPCTDDAILDRYIAPLTQKGDSYGPLSSISFVSAKKGFIVSGKRIWGIFGEENQIKTAIRKPKPRKKKKNNVI
jgi:CRISPR-associated Cas5-like protein